jgi:TonB family protein
MYFDFEDYRPETPTLTSPLSRREGVMLSIMLHMGAIIFVLLVPEIPFFQRMQEEAARAAEMRRQQALQREEEPQQFVFVQPRIDVPAPKPPPRAELSDKDRQARALERSTNPTNPLPFSRGNSAERTDTAREPPGRPAPEARVPPDTSGSSSPGNGTSVPPRQGSLPAPPAGGEERPRIASGSIGNALRNLDRYVPQTFDNQQGGAQEPGAAIQFDTKGVDFGPWLARFVAQVKRNWFIPLAAMSMRGHVILTFNIHRDGSITDLQVAKPSSVDAFTHAAVNAIRGSNPTQPLPAEYPDDQAFFTVTFYYNEGPPR